MVSWCLVSSYSMIAMNKIDITKVRDLYGRKRTLLTDLQLVRAYYGDTGASVLSSAERILKNKYKEDWQRQVIRKTIISVQGTKHPVIHIKRLGLNHTPGEILSKFVDENFEKMVYESQHKVGYPLVIKDLIEKCIS